MDTEFELKIHGDAPPGNFGLFIARVDDSFTGAPTLPTDTLRLPPPSTTLAWGRRYLPKYFAKPSSTMHEWLGAQLDAFRKERGTKVNLIGPRGSAKSTIATLCYVLRAAVEGWEPYIWIVFRHNSAGANASRQREDGTHR